MKKVAFSAAIVALVSACGGDQEASGSMETAEIETGDGALKIQSNASGEVPADLALYPGARVSSASTYSGTAGQGTGSVMVFETDGSLEEVAEFYRKQIEGKGLSVESEVKTGDLIMLGARNGEDGGLTVTASRTGEGGATSVMIASGSGS